MTDHTNDAGHTAAETARLTADVVLFGANAQRGLCVLLIQRRYEPFEGHWALPGGHVDPGEHTHEAALRELTEETGLRVDGIIPFVAHGEPGRDPRGRYVTFAYLASLNCTPRPTAADDAADARWFPVNDALTERIPLAFDHLRLISEAYQVITGGAAR